MMDLNLLVPELFILADQDYQSIASRATKCCFLRDAVVKFYVDADSIFSLQLIESFDSHFV